MRRPCRVRLAALFIGFVLVLAAPEVKAHGGDASFIHSCVKNGKLRIVGPSDSCKPGATALDWPKTGSGLVLKDANGTFIGPYDYGSGGVFLSSLDGPVVAFVGPTGFYQTSSFGFLYASTNCSGPKLIQPRGGLVRNEMGTLEGTLYYFPIPGTTMTINSGDVRPSTPAQCVYPGQVFISPNICCCTAPGCLNPFTGSIRPVGTLDISGFVPPFHVELTA